MQVLEEVRDAYASITWYDTQFNILANQTHPETHYGLVFDANDVYTGGGGDKMYIPWRLQWINVYDCAIVRDYPDDQVLPDQYMRESFDPKEDADIDYAIPEYGVLLDAAFEARIDGEQQRYIDMKDYIEETSTMFRLGQNTRYDEIKRRRRV